MNTGKMTTVARPYAMAAFEFALENNDLQQWENMLNAAVVLVQDPAVLQMLLSPRVTSSQVAELCCDVLEKLLNEQRRNFIRLLAENERLMAMPDIAALFKSYREEKEKTVTVQVASAVPLDEKYKQTLSNALQKRLQKNVVMQCSVDADLIGGAVITAGDMVIDGSVRGKLNRLIEFI